MLYTLQLHDEGPWWEEANNSFRSWRGYNPGHLRTTLKSCFPECNLLSRSEKIQVQGVYIRVAALGRLHKNDQELEIICFYGKYGGSQKGPKSRKLPDSSDRMRDRKNISSESFWLSSCVQLMRCRYVWAARNRCSLTCFLTVWYYE